MADKYHNFDELNRNEKLDLDFTILHREVDSRIAVIAPHGGGIEPGTVDIADAVAGCDFVFYAFKGLKPRGNFALHISSNAFDEPLGVKVSRRAFITIAVHGCKDKSEMVHVGGKHEPLKKEMISSLKHAGFNAEHCDIPGLRGSKPGNICNRCRSGKGVQLEIARGLRETLFDNLHHRFLKKKTVLFYQFVDVLKRVLQAVEV